MSNLAPEDQRKIQLMWDWIKDFRGDNVSRTASSVYVGSPADRPGHANTDWRPQQFRVKSEENDYIVAVPYRADKDEAGETEYKIAKPVEMRGGTERWGAYPPYVAEVSVIWAAPLLYNGAQDADENPILLVDLNFEGRSADGFWAQITGSSEESANVGLYDATEQVPSAGGFATLANGRVLSGVIRNSIEENNSSSGVQGNSVDLSGDIFSDNADLELKLVTGDPVVWVRRYKTGAESYEYRFSYVNAIDGECA